MLCYLVINMCYYCYWGLPRDVAKIYLEARLALLKLGHSTSVLHFGASHAVWEDYNFDGCVEDCIANFDKWNDKNYSDEESEIALQSLQKLSALPLHIRDPIPEKYHTGASQYKPKPEWNLIKV